LDALQTLPYRHVREGLAEICKAGIIEGHDLFDALETLAPHPLHKWPWDHLVSEAIKVKTMIVNDDRHEAGSREVLNLGHTFGHALEAEAGFSDTLLHGEAVAAGMALAFGFSAAQGFAPQADAARVAAHLRATGLPDGARAAGVDADGATLVAHMLHDKKMHGGALPFLLARGIGQTYLDKQVDLAAVREFLDATA
ncbi:MAG: 3-dehydroquinate synthase, partial [Pseudomonadota bacterium]|nr:3-dehydroquinate synthase [Pseudomonadota bacterium]